MVLLAFPSKSPKKGCTSHTHFCQLPPMTGRPGLSPTEGHGHIAITVEVGTGRHSVAVLSKNYRDRPKVVYPVDVAGEPDGSGWGHYFDCFWGLLKLEKVIVSLKPTT